MFPFANAACSIVFSPVSAINNNIPSRSICRIVKNRWWDFQSLANTSSHFWWYLHFSLEPQLPRTTQRKDYVNALLEHSDIHQMVRGPYDSRRFGRSLAVNALPIGSRVCNFDCVYCGCATGSWPLAWELRPQFPSAESIQAALLAAANSAVADDLDSIIIAGNGEPSLSPHLNNIVDTVNAARNRDWPQARTIILSNGTMCHKPDVRAAFAKLDERVIKLDAGSNWILDQMNRPVSKLSLTELLRRISMMPEIIIQSMFVHGPVDNTGAKEIAAWTGWLARLRPACVHIYSLDRHPAAMNWVREVDRNVLESIAKYVESNTGIPTHVF